jgi:hypothetical protein
LAANLPYAFVIAETVVMNQGGGANKYQRRGFFPNEVRKSALSRAGIGAARGNRRCPARKSALSRAEIGAVPRGNRRCPAEIGAAPRGKTSEQKKGEAGIDADLPNCVDAAEV